ncbi:uncharacterized HIT-like protein Synpcc7942_1390 [Cylas formicarius]|uniref:uncharacterized HIT-like protein Synpcc7942_1390 n=1 Tax=Cylas formicarius TaxID=197179 RepID=UPI002958D6B1|nr:uncharacterized HIT-like protein Synpcc7942_1390 [Cylas formicarius]
MNLMFFNHFMRTRTVFSRKYRNWKAFGLNSTWFSSEVDKANQSKYDQTSETVFDKIIRKQIPADIIHEDDKCIAFNDVSPQAPIHFLVIPKKRIAMLGLCSGTDSEILSHILLTAKDLANERLPDGYRLVINNGRDGCQSVYHLHIHILGGRQMNWPPG